jgi:hypothetical protein
MVKYSDVTFQVCNVEIRLRKTLGKETKYEIVVSSSYLPTSKRMSNEQHIIATYKTTLTGYTAILKMVLDSEDLKPYLYD